MMVKKVVLWEARNCPEEMSIPAVEDKTLLLHDLFNQEHSHSHTPFTHHEVSIFGILLWPQASESNLQFLVFLMCFFVTQWTFRGQDMVTGLKKDVHKISTLKLTSFGWLTHHTRSVVGRLPLTVEISGSWSHLLKNGRLAWWDHQDHNHRLNSWRLKET